MAQDRDWEIQQNLAKAKAQMMDCPEGSHPVDMCSETLRGAGSRRPSPTEEAEKLHHHHREESERAGRAAKFLAQHPEFSLFIELIRDGSIRI